MNSSRSERLSRGHDGMAHACQQMRRARLWVCVGWRAVRYAVREGVVTYGGIGVKIGGRRGGEESVQTESIEAAFG